MVDFKKVKKWVFPHKRKTKNKEITIRGYYRTTKLLIPTKKGD